MPFDKKKSSHTLKSIKPRIVQKGKNIMICSYFNVIYDGGYHVLPVTWTAGVFQTLNPLFRRAYSSNVLKETNIRVGYNNSDVKACIGENRKSPYTNITSLAAIYVRIVCVCVIQCNNVCGCLNCINHNRITYTVGPPCSGIYNNDYTIIF